MKQAASGPPGAPAHCAATEDQVGVHLLTLRHPRSRHTRCCRLQTDGPLLLICPRPLRPRRHNEPTTPTILWWTLSVSLCVRQSSDAGRLPFLARSGASFARRASVAVTHSALILHLALSRTKYDEWLAPAVVQERRDMPGDNITGRELFPRCKIQPLSVGLPMTGEVPRDAIGIGPENWHRPRDRDPGR